MPADSSTAPGWSARMRAASSARRDERRRRSSPRGATAMSPRSRSAGAVRDEVGQRRHVARRRTAAGGELARRSPEVDLHQHVDGPVAVPAGPVQGAREGRPVDGVHDGARAGPRRRPCCAAAGR